jgi:hypothetical protein
MKQILLATALIALPVAAFTGFNLYAAKASIGAPAASGLGDTSMLTTIITDVQANAAKGDFGAAKTRIKDFEIAWDNNEKGLKPMDPAHWALIDGAADDALTAVRAKAPDPAEVTQTLVALQAALETPAVQK